MRSTMRRGCVVASLIALTLASAPAASGRSLDRPAQEGQRPTKQGGVAAPGPCPGCDAPALRTSWQWQLQWKVDTSLDVQMYDVDGFNVSKALVRKLHDA